MRRCAGPVAHVRRGVGWAVVVQLTFVICLQHRASASGNAIARFGGEHGTVNALNPTALYYNPGALGFSDGVQLFVDGQLALRSLQWSHQLAPTDAAEADGFAGANSGTAKALNVFGGPMLGGSLRVGDFVFGAAGYAPFGGNVSFERNERFAGTQYPGAADGVARWHAFDAATMSIYGTVGAAYRYGPVSIGLTANLIYTTVSLDRAQNVDGSNDLTGEGRSRLRASGLNGSFGAGVLVELVPQLLWLGASYQAQPGLGTMALNGTLEVDATIPRDPENALRSDITLHQALPDIWRLGARWKPAADLELRVAGDLTRWSVSRTQCVAVRGLACVVDADGNATEDSGVVINMRRYWRDTVGVRVGASYWATPGLELFAGLGYESAAAPDTTIDPVLADASNIAAAIGGRLQVLDTWFIAASYTQLQFLDRDNTGKSQLADLEVGAVTRRPDGGGRYSQWVGILNANVLKQF
ncbi:MAG: outer membrane protein transport protein [Polyangiales bacterium]